MRKFTVAYELFKIITVYNLYFVISKMVAVRIV